MNLSGLKGSKLTLMLCAVLFVALAVLLFAQTGGDKGTASQEERRMAEVLSAMAGAGKVEVALFYEKGQKDAFGASASEKPMGAVVVAEGAGDMSVRLSLIRAVRTLLSLPEAAVDVFVMEENR
ncbi:MAG: hypothetical protein RR367_05690 [Clostridia bacterium]